jgi:phosphoribosyl 1,2-cyclic phosphodiesterase
MELTVLASSSSGNGYILHNDNEALVIEAGVRFKEVQKALDFNISIVKGCILSHEHGDHAKYVKEYLNRGVNVFTSEGTINKLNLYGERKPVAVKPKQVFKAGNFKIMPFDVIHDAEEPFGYIIDHPESGKVLFLTDTHYSTYKFKGLSHVIVEANYVDEIVDDLLNSGKLELFRYKRIHNSHMSLRTCKKLLGANDLSNVVNIVLIHLSDGHSNEELMKREVVEQTGRMVHVANKGMTIPFNKSVL